MKLPGRASASMFVTYEGPICSSVTHACSSKSGLLDKADGNTKLGRPPGGGYPARATADHKVVEVLDHVHRRHLLARFGQRVEMGTVTGITVYDAITAGEYVQRRPMTFT